MQALVHTKPYEFEFRSDFPTPEISANEVLVRVKAVGICGSDVKGMTGTTGRRIPPIIMGHEAAGEIAETGKAVSRYKVGQRVTFDSMVYCNNCPVCFSGRFNLCENRMVLGVSPAEYRRHGAMAEYVAIPEHILYPIPDNLGYELAAMAEPLSIAFHAIERSSLRLNDTVAVIGCGMIGLLVVQAAKLRGCGKLIAIDIDENKLQRAASYGADHCINPLTSNAEQVIAELTKGRGVDLSLEVVGAEQPVQLAFAAVKKGGIVTLVGNVTPEVTLPLQKVVTSEIDVRGSCSSAGEYQACIDMMAAGKVDVASMISCQVPLSEGAKWFNTLYENKEPLFKVILEP